MGSTAGEDRFEVTHEALVRSWPRLADWLEEARVEQRKRLRLTSQAQQWDALNRDKSALLRGLVLQEAQQYHDLDDLETLFVQASLDEANRAEKEAEEARQQELKIVRRNNRRLLLLTFLLLFFFGAAMIFAVFARMSLEVAQENAERAAAAEATAVWNAERAATAQAEADAQREAAIIDRDAAEQSAQLAEEAKQEAETERENAELAQVEAEEARAEAEANARQSLSRELSSQAINQLESDPTLSLLLAVEAAYIPLANNEFVPPRNHRCSLPCPRSITVTTDVAWTRRPNYGRFHHPGNDNKSRTHIHRQSRWHGQSVGRTIGASNCNPQ